MAPRGRRPAEIPVPEDKPHCFGKTIWFILVDYGPQLSFGDSTKLYVQADTDFDDLKRMISLKAEKQVDLAPFDANKLEEGVGIQPPGAHAEHASRPPTISCKFFESKNCKR